MRPAVAMVLQGGAPGGGDNAARWRDRWRCCHRQATTGNSAAARRMLRPAAVVLQGGAAGGGAAIGSTLGGGGGHEDADDHHPLRLAAGDRHGRIALRDARAPCSHLPSRASREAGAATRTPTTTARSASPPATATAASPCRGRARAVLALRSVAPPVAGPGHKRRRAGALRRPAPAQAAACRPSGGRAPAAACRALRLAPRLHPRALRRL
nr:uncharacterized protein LOC127303956 [Lolium perenne]